MYAFQFPDQHNNVKIPLGSIKSTHGPPMKKCIRKFIEFGPELDDIYTEIFAPDQAPNVFFLLIIYHTLHTFNKQTIFVVNILCCKL